MTVADLQTGVTINDDEISGELAYISSGAMATAYGTGNFLVLSFTNLSESAKTVRAGLQPSMGTSFVDIKADENNRGIFKITNADAQKLVVEQTDGIYSLSQTYDLSGLTLDEA